MRGSIIRLGSIRRSERGVTLGELLAVLAIIGIAVGVAIPLVADSVREAKIRAAADEFALTLKAARMIAVTQNANVAVAVSANPTNSYTYTDRNGRTRGFDLPDGVVIASSTTPITFRPNGSLTGSPPSQATTVLEATLTHNTIDRWTVTTSVIGLATIEHERIHP